MIKKILAGLLSIVMVLSLASCNTDKEWIISSGDVSISSGVYLGYLVNSTLDAMSANECTTAKDLMKLTIENKPAAEYVKEKALDYCKTYIVVEQKFSELGLELSEEDNSDIDSTTNAYLTYYAAYYGDNGCGAASLRKIVESNVKLEKIFLHYYGEGGEKEVSKDDLLKQLTENYARVQFISIPLVETSTGLSLEGDDLQEAKDSADKYLERAKNGEDFPALMEEYSKSLEDSDEEETEEEEHDHDHDHEEEEEILDNGFTKNDTLVKKDDETSYPEGFVDGVFEMKNGEYKLIKTENYYFVTTRLNITESDKTLEYYTETLISDLKFEEFEGTYGEWKAAASYNTNNAGIKKYKAKKIKIDLSQNYTY